MGIYGTPSTTFHSTIENFSFGIHHTSLVEMFFIPFLSLLKHPLSIHDLPILPSPFTQLLIHHGFHEFVIGLRSKVVTADD